MSKKKSILYFFILPKSSPFIMFEIHLFLSKVFLLLPANYTIESLSAIIHKKTENFFFCFLLFLLSAKAEMEFLYLADSAHPGFPKMPDSSYNLLSKTHIYTILSFGQSKTLNSLFIVDDT